MKVFMEHAAKEIDGTRNWTCPGKRAHYFSGDSPGGRWVEGSRVGLGIYSSCSSLERHLYLAFSTTLSFVVPSQLSPLAHLILVETLIDTAFRMMLWSGSTILPPLQAVHALLQLCACACRAASGGSLPLLWWGILLILYDFSRQLFSSNLFGCHQGQNYRFLLSYSVDIYNFDNTLNYIHVEMVKSQSTTIPGIR